MFKNTIKIPVEWGHCDPARIVFYPNYFFWFDQATRHLFDSVGLSYEIMLDKYGTIGFPLVDAHAEFLSPTRFGDEIEITSYVNEWRRKTIVVIHEIKNRNKVCVKGTEIRIWAETDSKDSKKLKSKEIPSNFKGFFVKEIESC
jgi:4-hydroxybenzoyl-CoA thioesterase